MIWFILSFLTATISAPIMPAVSPSTPQSGETLYLNSCAACHGVDGRGAAQAMVGFDQPLPDFTDCQFAPREPDGDWVTVAFLGGPSRGFSELMPAFGEVLTMEELQRVVEHIRSFCRDKRFPRGDLNLPKAMVTEKAFPEDELIVLSSFNAKRFDMANKLIYEKRIGALNQVEVVIPFSWNRTMDELSGENLLSASLGDLALAYKRVLFHSLKSGSILSMTGELVLPVGDEAGGVGGGTFVIEPFLAYSQILPAGFFMHLQTGVGLPLDRDKGASEGFLRLALGKSINFSPFGRTWSPMVELLAQKEFVGGEHIQYDLLPQLQVTLNKRQNIMFNIGVRIPLSETEHRDVKIMAYFLWDWFDGSLFEGW